MAFLKCLKGSSKSMGNVGIVEGQILICEDTREMFVDIDANTRINISSVVPGMIMLWSGHPDNIPYGWALCNGANGTPDLTDKFVIGAGGEYSTGDIGGEESVALKVDQIPAHSHALPENVLTDNEAGSFKIINGTYVGNVKVTTINTTTDSGGSMPHNNMPPYYALCYIMKT